ncbi:hypothetical protein ACXYX3_03975 [Mycobacterium sp. C3-094]
MTTHDQHTDQSRQFSTENPSYIPEDQVAPTRDDVTGTQGAGPPTAPMDPQVAGAQHHPDQHHREEHHHERETDPDAGLFAHDELAGLRARWDAVQASFVDDPKDCVQKADSLVADLVQQLTTGFGQARSRLEDQWSRGEQASTEDLRVALKRYRSFFERLLTV